MSNTTPPGQETKKKASSFDRTWPWLLGVLAFWWLLKPVGSILYALFISFLIAYVMDPLMDWAEEKKIPRGFSAAVLIGVFFLGILGFMVWIIPPLFHELERASQAIVQLSETWLPGALASLEQTFGISVEQSLVALQEKVREYGPELVRNLGSVMGAGAQTTVSALSKLVYLAVIPLFVFYLARDFDRITGWIKEQIPVQKRAFFVHHVTSADKVIGQWLRGQVQVALILALFYAVGLYLSGIPLAIPIGLLAGLLSVIPYLGGALGFTLAMMMALLTLDGGTSAIAVAAIFLVANILEGYVLTPKIVGEKVGLSPLVVLVVLLIGGEALGIFGVLIAVPVAGVMKVFGSEVLNWYRESKHFKGDERPAETIEGTP